ncbi:MAG: uridine phosphorylase [Anaerolineaceae bacterium]
MRNENGLAFHLHIKEGDVGRYVLLPGDPGRCEKIAKYFENPHFVAQNREYVTWTGSLCGEKVSVVSTGIGCPSTAIAVEELVDVGADTFIRVGSSGSMQANVHAGDVAIVTASIRDEGTTSQYLPLAYPAVADVDIVIALREAAEKLGQRHHLGVSQSKDSFYGEVERTRMPMAAMLTERWNAWVAGGAVCSEMESAVLFILSSIYRKRAGGAMLVVNESELSDLAEDDAAKSMPEFDADAVIRVAIEGIKILIAKDQALTK